MRMIDADVFRLRLASIAKTFARTDAQKSLMGRCMHCLDKTTTVAEWVSVKDRLPDKNDNYIVCVKLPYVHQPLYVCISPYRLVHPDCFGCFGIFNEKEGQMFRGAVTHWMPLPPPPKEVKE